MSNATELAGSVINLDALNKYNAEQVEAGLFHPINIRCLRQG